jgi:hypothetical protein
LTFAAAIVVHRARRKNLDRQVRRVPRDFARIDEMSACSGEHQQIGLHHVVLGEHDVERRKEHEATVRSNMLFKPEVQTRGRNLMCPRSPVAISAIALSAKFGVA